MALPHVAPAQITTELDEVIAFAEIFQLPKLLESIFSCSKSNKRRESLSTFTLIEYIDILDQDYLALLIERISNLPNGANLLDNISELKGMGISIDPEAGSTTHFFFGTSNKANGVVILEIIDAAQSRILEFENVNQYSIINSTGKTLDL